MDGPGWIARFDETTEINKKPRISPGFFVILVTCYLLRFDTSPSNAQTNH